MNDQRSLTEQLRTAYGVLNQAGLYDAADYCQRAVERADEQARELASMTPEQMHARSSHPDWEYTRTEGQRKQWDQQNIPPDGEGWVRNVEMGDAGWERFEFTEESYWRRPKAGPR